MKPGTKLGFLALALAFACSATWFYLNRTVGIPENRALFVVGFLAAAALGIAAFVRGTRWSGGLAGGVAIVIGSFLPFTVMISPQQVGAQSIQVGDSIPHFTAVNEHGERFDSRSLQGHLALIKFFRAHW